MVPLGTDEELTLISIHVEDDILIQLTVIEDRTTLERLLGPVVGPVKTEWIGLWQIASV